MRKAVMHVSLVFVLISTLLLTHIINPIIATGQNSWAYQGWLYRSLVTVSNSSGKSLENYTVSLRIQNNTHLFTNIAPNGQDIRLTDENGTPIPYWIRRFEPSSGLIVINTRLPILKNDNNYIYIYYGNQSASAESNPRATFDYYQDFSSFNPTVKFGIFTDIHHDSNNNNHWTTPDFQDGKLADARPRLQTIISAMNSWNADFLITLGDLITAEDWVAKSWTGDSYNNCVPLSQMCSGHINDCKEVVECPTSAQTALTQIESTFRTFNNKRYYAIDNHEYYSLSPLEVMYTIGGQGAIGTSSGVKEPYYSFDQNGVRFIILDLQWDYTNNRHRGPEGASDYGESYMHPTQIAWLNTQLSTSPHPVVIFSSSRLENHDFLTFQQCQNYLQYDYCTDSRCADGSCVADCNELYDYRWVRNGADIRALLETHHQKIVAVFQGDHHARYHYNQNGVNYFSLKSSDQVNPTDVAYVKVEIDPTQKLMAIEGIGGTNNTNKFKISYEAGKMVIDNHRESSFLPAPLILDKQWNLQNDVLIETGWSINPLEPAQQLLVGFWENMDYPQIRHRCATNGRIRKSNFVGARRVFSNSGTNNYIGTQLNHQGISTTSLNLATTATTGYFWVQQSDNIVRTWFNAGTAAGKLDTDINISALSGRLSPGIWVFDNTTGANKAYIDNVIIRTAVYPEPIVTNISSPETAPNPITYQDIITFFNKPSSPPTDLNSDGITNIFDLNVWLKHQ